MPTISETIETLLDRNLRHVLRANYIDVGEGHLCQEFLQILQKFIRRISKRYEMEIDVLLRQHRPPWKRQDLISWVISEVASLQSITMSRLYFRVCEDEGLAAGQHRVDCGQAHGHAYLLSQIYEEADLEWKRDRKTEPLSQKARIKRRRRDWAPWLVDIVFD